ncbi:MAG TPA: hypothetical protein VGN36_04020 [Sphingorhabdus sp.]|nr:hypothetical protein [Sphingorhabdus sp.]
MKGLARWIMNRVAGDGRSDWALAMQREFEALESGHFGWALGCATVELRNGFGIYGSMILAVTAVHFLAPVLAAVVAIPAYRYGGNALSQVVAFGYAAPWAFLLGMYRPQYILAICLTGGVILPAASGYLVAKAILNIGFVDYFSGIGATMLVGLNSIGTVAMLLLWYGCATLGARLAKRNYSS